MTSAQAAYHHGFAVGQQINYVKGDLFREDFDYPVNPYLKNHTLRDQFQRGVEIGLGAQFQSDFDLWQTIEIEFTFTHKTWSIADIRQEGRARLKRQAA